GGRRSAGEMFSRGSGCGEMNEFSRDRQAEAAVRWPGRPLGFSGPCTNLRSNAVAARLGDRDVLDVLA
ncbi:hypothetical protein N9L68_01765, partial [bacterium]|nr:hypothetical protein [bacterium]